MDRCIRRAVIIGAGIAGPVLGMWLRKLGVEVVLAEARPSAALGEGAFLGLAPNGMNVLADLGLGEAVSALGHACAGFCFSNAQSRPIGYIDRSHDRAAFSWPLTMMRRDRLHLLLAEEAARRGVELRYGLRLAAFEPSETSVGARFADGSSLEGDVLIGADGLRSTVRTLAIPNAPPPLSAGLIDVGGFCHVPGLPLQPGVNEMVFGRRAFFGAFLTPHGETWWFHNGPPPPEALQDPEALRARLLDLHRDDPAWISDVVRATPRPLGPWPLHELDAMPRWSAGRVCLIGDAAHAMSPSAGQGASMAIEDAVVLAQCLRDLDDPVQAFHAFERRRRPRVDAIFQAARRQSNNKTTSGPVAEWFRDRLLPLFLRLGAAGQNRSYAHRIDWEARVAWDAT